MVDHTHHLGYWVKQYTLLVNHALDKTLKPYGIGRSQWYVLYHLHHEGEMPQRRLQDVLQVESATLTNLMATLVKKELVKQSIDPSNKRHKLAQLTVKGEALWAEMPDPLQQVRSRSLQGIDAADIAVARDVLRAAVNNLKGNESKEDISYETRKYF